MKMLSKRGTMWILVLQICLFLEYCLVFTSKFNSFSDFVFFGLQVSCISIWFFVFTKKTMQLFWFWYSVRFPVFNKEILERRTNFASVLVLFLMFSVLINIFFAGLSNFFFCSLADSIRPQCPLPQQLIMWTTFSWH